MKLFRTFLFLTLAAFAPTNVFACAACGSANPNAEHSSMADGMNLGILTLLGVLLTVLSVCLFGLVHLIRKSEALTAAAEKAARQAAEMPAN